MESEHRESLFRKPKNSKFEKIFFWIIEFHHTIILQKESRETVYTALRKVVRGPRASPSKTVSKQHFGRRLAVVVIYYREFLMILACFYEQKFYKNQEKVGKLSVSCSKLCQDACCGYIT